MKMTGKLFRLAALPVFSLLLAAQEGQANPHLHWREVAVVAGDRIRLSDLLAPASADEDRVTAEKIDLGRAPEPGSFRIFSRAELRRAVGTDLGSNLPAQIIVHDEGWPLSSENITLALADAGLTSGSVSVAGAIRTRSPRAVLRVTGLRTGPGSLQVRFACQQRSDCAPFWGEMNAETNARPSAGKKLAPRPPLHPISLVGPRHSALLICDEPGIEIRLRVRPLRAAALGDRVKVFDPATRRIFVARVKAENVVESDLKEVQ